MMWRSIRVMKTPSFYRHVLGVLAAVCLDACVVAPDSETKPMGENVLSPQAIRAAKSEPVSFVAQVKPVLEGKCVMCHNRQSLPGHMHLESRRAAMLSGALGTFIVSGHPERSPLLGSAGYSHHSVSAMPIVGERLTVEESAILTKWIKEGASWPAGPAGTLRTIR